MPLRAQPPASFRDRSIGKPALIGAGVSTAVGMITDSPEEWGRGPDGVGKRFGSSLGKNFIKTSVEIGIARVRHEDLRYHRSEDPGFGRRMRHALLGAVVTKNTLTGGPTLAAGRLSGAFAGGFASRLWMPDRLRTVSSGFSTSFTSVGIDAGMNVFKEFWPLRRRKQAPAAPAAPAEP